MNIRNSKQENMGNASIAMILALAFVFALSMAFDVRQDSGAQSVQATSTATTTVTVLNLPPNWVVTAREVTASATNTPTNSGSVISWTATAEDNNSENYRLLICMSSSTPNATIPQCGGGVNDQWAISPWTASGDAAIASTTTSNDWAESNDWYGYICDNNEGLPRCNDIMYNGLHEPGPVSATSSPFVVNRRPLITFASDDSPVFPGDQVIWTSSSSDPDILRNPLGDLIQLHVCRTPNFDTSIPGCTDGHWASSTAFVQSNAGATTTIPIPTQAGDLGAYVFVIDERDHVSFGEFSGSDTVLTINNAPPTISSASINVWGVFGSSSLETNLVLTEPEGETQNFVVTLEVEDVNGCLNTANENEVSDVEINVFRSGVGTTSCSVSGDYNANNCYVHENPQFNPVCVQTAASCTANDWTAIDWECTFPLWYIADATDPGSQFESEDWRASARAIDSGSATGTYATEDKAANAGAQMLQFLSFRATGSPIAYGAWEPNSGTPNHPATTTLFATGNTGLHQYLSGDPMCVTYPNCTGLATSTIFVENQRYSTSSATLFGSGTQLVASTSAALLEIGINKTSSTTAPASGDTFWGIFVPDTITFAGDYVGRNYIDAVISPSSSW